MASIPEQIAAQQPAPRRRPLWKRLLLWGSVTAAIVLVALLAVAAYIAHNAEPLLRQRVVAALSERFRSPVELDQLHISAVKGLEVSGSGLRIQSLQGPAPAGVTLSGAPMLSIGKFQFRTEIRELFSPTIHIATVRVEGMTIRIPPRTPHPAVSTTLPAQPNSPSRVHLSVGELVCAGTQLILETNRPGKDPMVFNIPSLRLEGVSASRPFAYQATLVNPKPTGDIEASGHFGPWLSPEPAAPDANAPNNGVIQTGGLRSAPLDGQYRFTHADLNTIHGLGGTLSSTGSFHGKLDEIVVDGVTDTPNFSLDIANHPVPLHTEFHAIVDGSSGDTTLAPVHARFLRSYVTATGSITRTHGVPGHTIDIQCASNQARIEDLLTLGVKGSPPLLSGALTFRGHVFIPPAPVSVSRRMRLDGSFSVSSATFSKGSFQDTIDKLSMRAQGRAKEANSVDAERVTSSVSGDFRIAGGITHLSNLDYRLPGARVQLNGLYNMPDDLVDFAGTVQTQATASQLTTGWKSMLLRPFDNLLRTDNAGLEVPITIKGTRAQPKFGVDFSKMRFGRHSSGQAPQ